MASVCLGKNGPRLCFPYFSMFPCQLFLQLLVILSAQNSEKQALLLAQLIQLQLHFIIITLQFLLLLYIHY